MVAFTEFFDYPIFDGLPPWAPVAVAGVVVLFLASAAMRLYRAGMRNASLILAFFAAGGSVPGWKSIRHWFEVKGWL